MTTPPTYEELQQRVDLLEKELARFHDIEKALHESKSKAHETSLELSIGLSEVFEALGEMAKGNPYVRIFEHSSLELIKRLKQHVNRAATNLEDIVELSHEFAMGLAEHFDVLRRVSKGELGARVAGTSSVELLEALKKVTNGMIENVSKAFEKKEETEIALANERKRLFSLLNSLPMYVYLQAPDHSIRFANRCFKEHFGEPNGKPCYEIITESDHPCETCRPFSVLDTGEPIEWEWKRKNGKTYEILDYPFVDTDGTPLVLELGIDITKRKQAEREKQELEDRFHQAQKMEALGILAGSIIHDFNNLLMVIQSDASMMLREIDAHHPHYEKLTSIKQEVRSGAGLLEQMLGFARGGAAFATRANVNDLAQETCDMFIRTKPEIDVTTRFEKKLWETEVNTGQIGQVLLNLFINAEDAMAGEGSLEIRTENTTLNKRELIPYPVKPGPYVRISVKDQGIGMDEETKQRIFEPFFTTKQKGRGTGLGLASAYGIIKEHGGIITVQSQPGKGSTFHIYLPAVQ